MDSEKKNVIIIPSRPIAPENGWDTEIFPIIKAYAEFYGDEIVPPTSLYNIEKNEKRLGTSLPKDLKLFYLKFGAAKLIETLLTVDDFVYLNSSWDKSFLDLYSPTEQEVISKLIVFGTYLGNGNLWCFHKDTKEIFYFKHDSKPNINGVFDSFSDYLKPLLIYSQGEMSQHIDEHEVEEIVVSFIGKDRVKVWQYFSGWE